MEQLFFGWSEEGLEGYNRQQVIAASLGLSDTRGPLAQVVLAQCYSPLTATFGWCESGKYRVAFRRTPLGLDGRGRPGNYLVHAVAGTPDEFKAEVITPLVSGLLDHLPVGTDKELPQIDITESPEPLPSELHETAVNALAYYLDNLSHGRLTAIPMDAVDAGMLAAFIASVMPPELGLVGFSAGERPDVAERFDILAQPPPTILFADVDVSIKPPRLAHYAAELLGAAAEGDQVAASCVALLVRDRPSRRAFVNALLNWVAIEHAEDGMLSDEALIWLTRESALRRRASGMPALRKIVDMAVAGSANAARVLKALYDDKNRRPQGMIIALLRDRSSCGDAFGALMECGADDLTRSILTTILSAGPLPSLGSLPVHLQIHLVNLFIDRSANFAPVRSILECSSELARIVVGNANYRVDWQVLAAREHPSRLRETDIASLVSRAPRSIKGLVSSGAPGSLLGLVEESFLKIEVSSAVEALQELEGGASPRLRNSCWRRLVSRLGPSEYYALITDRRWSMVGAADAVAAYLECVRNAWLCHLAIPSVGPLVRALNRMEDVEAEWRKIAVTLLRFENTSAGPRDVAALGTLANELANSRSEFVWLVTYGRILEESTFARFASLAVAACEWHGDVGCASRLLSAAQFSIAPQAVEWLVRWVIVDSGIDSHRDKKLMKTLEAERVREVAERVRFIDGQTMYKLSTSRSVRRWVLAAVPQERRGRWFMSGGD